MEDIRFTLECNIDFKTKNQINQNQVPDVMMNIHY
jgi:hypothetical protein